MDDDGDDDGDDDDDCEDAQPGSDAAEESQMEFDDTTPQQPTLQEPCVLLVHKDGHFSRCNQVHNNHLLTGMCGAWEVDPIASKQAGNNAKMMKVCSSCFNFDNK